MVTDHAHRHDVIMESLLRGARVIQSCTCGALIYTFFVNLFDIKNDYSR